MAGPALEGSQFDARQSDAKIENISSGTSDDATATSKEVHETSDVMGLHNNRDDNLLRGVYASCYEDPSSAIHQSGTLPLSDPQLALALQQQELDQQQQQQQQLLNQQPRLQTSLISGPSASTPQHRPGGYKNRPRNRKYR